MIIQSNFLWKTTSPRDFRFSNILFNLIIVILLPLCFFCFLFEVLAAVGWGWIFKIVKELNICRLLLFAMAMGSSIYFPFNCCFWWSLGQRAASYYELMWYVQFSDASLLYYDQLFTFVKTKIGRRDVTNEWLWCSKLGLLMQWRAQGDDRRWSEV